VATRVSAIPELIEDGVTGLLTPERDSVALGLALQRLIVDPGVRARLGQAGQRRVAEQFSFGAGVNRLASHFQLMLAGART
jgi:glycosyltransferase involved in cell wall biosynthesis